MVVIKQSLSAVRAIASEFARRIFKPVALIAGIGGIVLLGLVIWLCTMSAWWLFLAVPVILALIILAVLLSVAGVIIHIVSPEQTKTQRVKVGTFVDKIQRLSEITQTPKVVLLTRAVRDVVSPRSDGFVRSVVADTSSLKNEFTELVQSFSE